LHPAALDRFTADITRLADLAAAHSELPEARELVEALRNLVVEVVVHAPPNTTELRVAIKTRIDALTGISTFMMRSWGGGLVGSGGPTPADPPPPDRRNFASDLPEAADRRTGSR